MSLISSGLKMQAADSCIFSVQWSFAAAQINPLMLHFLIFREIMKLYSLISFLFSTRATSIHCTMSHCRALWGAVNFCAVIYSAEVKDRLIS